jgi:hypothetical protein
MARLLVPRADKPPPRLLNHQAANCWRDSYPVGIARSNDSELRASRSRGNESLDRATPIRACWGAYILTMTGRLSRRRPRAGSSFNLGRFHPQRSHPSIRAPPTSIIASPTSMSFPITTIIRRVGFMKRKDRVSLPKQRGVIVRQLTLSGDRGSRTSTRFKQSRLRDAMQSRRVRLPAKAGIRRRRLLLLGADRADEVDPYHPLART